MLNVGDTVYEHDWSGNIYELQIRGICAATDKPIIYDTEGVAFDTTAIGEHIFLSAEEAEKHYKATQRGGATCGTR